MVFGHRLALAATATLTLSLALVACGGAGGAARSPLPDHVVIDAATQAETAAPVDFATDIAAPPAGVAFHWDFGDGSSADGATARHAFAISGDYTISLTLTDSTGATRHASAQVAVAFFSNVAGLNCSGAASTGWCWQDALLTGHDVGTVRFVDATHGWAVGAHGTIAATADAGATWSLQASPDVDDLGDVRFADPLHGWAMGPLHGLRTVDGGNTWTANTIGDVERWAYTPTIASADPAAVAITTFTGEGTAVSVDNGATWSRLSIRAVDGVTVSSNGDCWTETNLVVSRVAGCGGAVTSSALPHPADFQGFASPVFVADPRHARLTAFGYSQAAGDFLMLGWETADGGATWSTFTPTAFAGKASNQQMYGDVGWVQPTGGGTNLLRTTDGGHSWTRHAPPLDCPTFCGVAMGSFDGVTAWESTGGELVFTQDGGTTWRQLLVPAAYGAASAQLLAVSSDGRSLVVAVMGRVIVSRDGGATWARTLGRDPVDGMGSGQAVAFGSGKAGVSLSSNGILRATSDGGRSWSHLYLPVTLADWPVDVRLLDAHEGWALSQGALQRLTDGGATLGAPVAIAGATRLVKMDWADTTHGAVIDESAVAWLSADGGATWTRADALAAIGSGRVADLAFVAPGSPVARLDDGSVATSADGGATWARRAGLPIDGIGLRLRATASGLWMVGSTPWRSLDGGATWKAVTLPAVSRVVDVTFADAARGWLIADGGQVLVTDDGGANWTTSALGADLSFARLAAADRRTAWIATAGGPLLATASGGR